MFWKPGGFYRDNKFNLWCCIDISNSHGLAFFCVKVRDSGDYRVKPKTAWFKPNGQSLDDDDVKLTQPTLHCRDGEWKYQSSH